MFSCVWIVLQILSIFCANYRKMMVPIVRAKRALTMYASL